MEVHERIKNLREDTDKKQSELCKLLKTTQPQYSRYERGERELKVSQLIEICKYYNVSADYVLGLPKGMPYGHSKTNR